ncbi:MAG: hypothetical protein M0D54_02455 [Hyphomonadaceae bacterium JAD_PAG50586_4]|nr:MAG: hypothetical protein M0D54_02455 [Hyphomonadaceae bacterium JAD_PAG50586_4]
MLHRIEKQHWRIATRHLEDIRVISLDWEEFAENDADDRALGNLICFIVTTLAEAQDDGMRYVLFVHGTERRSDIAVNSVSVTRLHVSEAPQTRKFLNRKGCRLFDEASLAEIRRPTKRRGRQRASMSRHEATGSGGPSDQFKSHTGHWRFAAVRFPDAVRLDLDPTHLRSDDYNWIYSWEEITLRTIIAARTAGASTAILVHGNPELPPGTISLREIVRNVMREESTAPYLRSADCIECDEAFIAVLRPLSSAARSG